MPENSRCAGIVGKFASHNYEAVFDEIESPSPSASLLTKFTGDPADLRPILVLTNRIYRGHVCTRCGNVINNSNPKNNNE